MLSYSVIENREALEQKKALHDEMAALSKLQSEALRVAIFLTFTRQQAAEYDARQIRMGEICKLLSQL